MKAEGMMRTTYIIFLMRRTKIYDSYQGELEHNHKWLAELAFTIESLIKSSSAISSNSDKA